MKLLNPYSYEEVKAQIELQKKFAWDLTKDIPWKMGVDATKPLVPLDEEALLFPKSSQEDRMAISQMMGLIIAAAICEMEESLTRLKNKCWIEIKETIPVSAEFEDLGELFFIEEEKHSSAFRKYLEIFSSSIGSTPDELNLLLPRIKDSKTELTLEKNLSSGGMAFWWIVAQVEQQFLFMHHLLRGHQDRLDPLYFTIHQRHFEEEARHASFPYLMLELKMKRSSSNLISKLQAQIDIALSQTLESFWTISSLQNLNQIKKIKMGNDFYDRIRKIQKVSLIQNPLTNIKKILTSVPFVSSLTNWNYHPKLLHFIQKHNLHTLPFPSPKLSKLVPY